MNYKNKPSLFKRESFYIVLFLVLAIIATIVAIALRNSANNTEESKVLENNTTIASAQNPDLNLPSNLEDKQGPPNSLLVDGTKDQNIANTENEINTANDENHSDVATEIQPTDDQTVTANDDQNVASEFFEDDEYADNDIDSEPVISTLDFGILKPAAGQIITDFDKFIQATSESGNQWFTFSNGIEISASVGAPVNAAADGVIASISYDLNGAVVTIDHGNGLQTVYKNLDPACLLVSTGETVTQNSQIGNIGEFDDVYVELGPRLGFEVIRNGEYQDPLKYFQY